MRLKGIILITITLASVFGVFFLLEPIAQDTRYHQFADKRIFLGIPNTLNVLSNIPFVMVGFLGTAFSVRFIKADRFGVGYFFYMIFFIGVFMTGIGSSYYHYLPSNISLFWDRLPMALAFMGFFCSVIAELIDQKVAGFLLAPLLLIGLGSVFYWIWTEQSGHGDLRLYALVQYLPFILIPLMMFMYTIPKNYLRYVMGLGGLYIISKLFEIHDSTIYEWIKIVSGHTLKHLFAAAGTYCILKMLYNRKYGGQYPERGIVAKRS